MSASARDVLRAAGLLGLCALLAAALLAGTHALTRDRIAAEQRQAQRAALSIVLPASSYDNDPLNDRIAVHAPAWLGTQEAMTIWRARRSGAPAGLILDAIAPDGYAGPIRLLIGIGADGRIAGVRVVEHHETPGLGDWIEKAKSDWIDSFTGRSLQDPARERWEVQRDGGEFDQFAGATVTPRAVVHAVRRALDYVARHGDELYAATADTTVTHADAPEN